MGVVAKGHPGAAIVWTDDGGENWSDAAIECSLPDRNPEALWLLDGQRGWALFYGGQPRRQALVKSEDGGKHWQEQPAPPLQKAWSLGQIWFDRQGTRGWINSLGGALWTTTDGGQVGEARSLAKYENGPLTAEGQPLPPNFRHPGMHVFSYEHLFLCGQAGAILETGDAGRTWKAQQIPLEPAADKRMHGSLTALHFTADGRAGWAIGGEGDRVQHPNGRVQLRHPVVVRTVRQGPNLAAEQA